ncbi:Spo0E like sporulation regulatory protein [Halobacillus karajensis]|uniref:Spo0E like sporulation regulatory protein n=2 Tax=Halobacillus karajensis TaxID=195088 RepID=A0A024P546_9BACI|nr:Spo0E like sporulation regulatory protein [Halobacillus karajensis]CDQ24000.1 Spo0E like sporulation regulatory protein [Halobacillus karajensis]CDQ27478.1 Spo0E like sporulation regulatory protein [Halobacillus karajensis]SEH90283.1 Spo0E like sporulation regulatory protein [Halobacillus karajensis]
MPYKEHLEQQIEELRSHMYEIYKNNPEDEELLKISQELDELLNRRDIQSIKALIK